MKDTRYRTLHYTETGLILFVWLVLLLTPILFREDNEKPIMGSVLNQLEILVPLTILFIVNRFLLVPYLLFRRKPVLFVTSVLVVIMLLASGTYGYYRVVKRVMYPVNGLADNGRESRETPPPARDGQSGASRPPRSTTPRPVPPYANFLIFSVLVVGFDTGLRSGAKWIMAEEEKVHLEKEKVAAQLTLLRSQVSPHFFMNTLNNIHALVDSNTTEAKEAIIRLSKLMRYLLYETGTEKTTLKKEVEFLESYISLMQLRFSEKVKITLNLPPAVPDISIPPFLFISFIENAFSHGISYKDESFITIDLVLGKDRLLFVVKNSKTDNIRMKDFSGIGIENSRKRLELLYADKYHLDIINNEDLFTVNLSIPL
jgi:hypothetical protein